MKYILVAFICFSTVVFGQVENKIEPFLPEIFIQFPNVRDISISSDGNEVYFSIQSYAPGVSVLAKVTRTNNAWSSPLILSFSGKYHDVEPFLSPDGLKLYFASNRPLSSDNKLAKDHDIWFVERESLNAEWSEPINMGAPINTKGNEFYPAITYSNNLYYTTDNGDTKGLDDIFLSEYINGEYQTPHSLDIAINSGGFEFNAYVSPDETLIIYTRFNSAGGFGSGDLYISKKNNGVWSPSKNMGPEINSAQMDYNPFYDSENQLLYFTSRRNSVPSQFNNKQSLDALMSKMKRYENGLSRIYKIVLNTSKF